MKLLILVLLMLAPQIARAYSPVNLPETMTVSDALEIFSADDITGGYISCADDLKAVDLSQDEAREFFNACESLELKRTVNPYPFSGVAVNLYIDDDIKTFFINSGVQLGLYGDNNYICYEFDGYCDEIMVMYSKYMESTEKYWHDRININTKRDFLKLPTADWAKEQIKTAAKNSLLPYQLISKYNANITREEFCILTANMIAVANNYTCLEDYMSDKHSSYLTDNFSDCKNADKSIDMLCALGVVNGKSENIFEPDSHLTREEAAVILKRTSALFGNFPVSGYMSFKDAGSISSWAYDYVLWAFGYKIMSGVSETEFQPQGTYTTEQAVTTINRLFNLVA